MANILPYDSPSCKGQMLMIATTPELDTLIAAGANVAYGVSGGKDGATGALEADAYLDSVGHTGERALIHSDLGRVEWRSSLPDCQRLADRMRRPLLVVRRERGDLMDRWAQRWHDNVARYVALECVRLILPWSTPSMRFCTSELKTSIIWRALANYWPGATIISAAGIRAEESADRAKKPILAPETKLISKRSRATGYNWLPILGYTLADVWAAHQRHGWEPAAPYGLGMTRVSCVFCILATQADLLTASSDPANHEIYREMVDLEILSGFSFQGTKWLGNVAPWLLTDQQLAGLALAMERAARRDEAQSLIPKHLMYTRAGWPEWMPTDSEAQLLADVRREVGRIYGWPVQYASAAGVLERYEGLIVAAGRLPTCYQGN